MTDDYEIPTGDTGHEPGTFLMTLTALKPFKLYETRTGWTREQPDQSQLIEAYDKIEWIFHDDQGGQGSGNTSTARSERSTLFTWATGLGLTPAVVLDRSKPIPASQLIGREGMVTFAPDKNGYSRITSVVPAPRARATAPVAASAPAAPAAPYERPTTPDEHFVMPRIEVPSATQPAAPAAAAPTDTSLPF